MANGRLGWRVDADTIWVFAAGGNRRRCARDEDCATRQYRQKGRDAHDRSPDAGLKVRGPAAGDSSAANHFTGYDWGWGGADLGILVTDHQVREVLTITDRSYLIKEAVNAYIELHRWQIEEIERAVAEADAGQTLAHDEVVTLLGAGAR